MIGKCSGPFTSEIKASCQYLYTRVELVLWLGHSFKNKYAIFCLSSFKTLSRTFKAQSFPSENLAEFACDKQIRIFGGGGGLVDRAADSGPCDLSLIPLVEKRENKQKEAGVGPY